MTSPYSPESTQPHRYGPSHALSPAPYPAAPAPTVAAAPPIGSPPPFAAPAPAAPPPPFAVPRSQLLAATCAPYGIDPASGLPLSDKSRVVVGLLQLVPGFVGGFGGIGRLYAGHTGLAVAQLVATILGWVSFVCGFILVFPFFFAFCFWLWFVVDGVVLMTGRPTTDGHGRLLRP